MLLKRFEESYEKHGMFQGSAVVLNPLTFMHKLGVIHKSDHMAKMRGWSLGDVARIKLMSLHPWGTLRNVKSEI